MAKTVTQQDFETAVMLMDRGVPATKVSKLLNYATGTLYVWKKQATWGKHESERLEFARQQRERTAAESYKVNTTPAQADAAETYATKPSEEMIPTDTVNQKLDRIIELLESAVIPVNRKVETKSEIARIFHR